MSTAFPADPKRWHTVATLGTAQTLAWASSYYLPAMLAAPMARDLGVSMPTVFAAFSVALVISALVGPAAGRAIDRHGGRPVLMATNLVFAAGLVSLGLAQGPVSMFAAWALIGLAMGSGLYEAAFAALVRLYGHEARNADHRHHADRRLRQHRGLAAVGLAGAEVRLARRLLHLGCAAPAAGPAAECTAAARPARPHAARTARHATAARAGRCSLRCSRPRADRSAAGLCVRGHLVRQHRDGHAPAAAAAGGRRHAGRGRGRGRIGRAGAGGRALAGIRPAAARAPDAVGAAGRAGPSAGCRAAAGRRRAGGRWCSRCCTAPATAS